MDKCRIVADNRARCKAQIHKQVEAALGKAVAEIEAQAKQAAPVDTGLLRNSILAQNIGHGKRRVSVFAWYGLYVEMGTRKKAAHPYLLPAFYRVVPNLKTAFRQILGR